MTQTGSVAEGRLSDWISLGVLASWVPRDAVDEAVEATGKGAKRKGGKLPPHVMVYFAMALALFAGEDYEEIWVRLSETLADWGCWDDSQASVTTGGLTQARQRQGQCPGRVPQGQGRDDRRVRVACAGAGRDRAVHVQGQRRAVPGQGP